MVKWEETPITTSSALQSSAHAFVDVDSWLIDPSSLGSDVFSPIFSSVQGDFSTTEEESIPGERKEVGNAKDLEDLSAKVWRTTVKYMRKAAVTMKIQESASTIDLGLFEHFSEDSLVSLLESASVCVHSLKAPLAACPAASTRVSYSAKRGRKPIYIHCFICKEEFPFKRELILHLKMQHKIVKSQSVMYKRIKEGEEVMKWRFWDRETKECEVAGMRKRPAEVAIN